MITIINFKTYKQGEEVIKLTKEIERTDKNIIIGVQAVDIREISKKTKLRVFVQHADYFEKGRNTGFVIPEAVKAAGASGVFINHSEHKLNFDIIKRTMKRCKEVGLKTAVFAADLGEMKKIERLKPTYLIFEPPELVAGKVSVSSAKPDMIKKISKAVKMKFLVGAGIHSRKDVEVALRLGASGIAISSAITQVKDPSAELRRLIL
ncbi:MAG: triose-phosphate isomerase [Candidatus Pacearchaeota archaeon]|nr:triose-phosphate isomerase [Candidatus Pacearchaeota archaeon]MDE1848479.1 triose-phosphate isomerase [Nanoarchaeota archaeon]